MKTRFRAGYGGHIWLAGLVLCMALTGCVTAPEVDWDARLGTYTRDMALADFGQPARIQKLSDGSELLEWTWSNATQNQWPGQPVSRESIYNDSPGSRGHPPATRVLDLTFGSDGKLVDWFRSH